MKQSADASLELAGRRALVTGSSGGIGRHIALALAKFGADVAVHGRSEARTESVAQAVRSLGRRSLALLGDMAGNESDRHSRAAVAAVVDAWGGIDILVNNVGEYEFKYARDHTDNEFERIMNGTIGTTFAASLEALKCMRQARWGRIVNITAAGAEQARGFREMGPHQAGKAAVVSLTRTLAMEEGPHGITINAVSPGIVDDRELTRHEAVFLQDEFAPVGRPGTSADIVDAVLYVVSPQAQFVNGAVLTIHGGWEAVSWDPPATSGGAAEA